MLSAMTDALMRRLGQAEPKCQSKETDKDIADFRYPEPGNAGRFSNLHVPKLLGTALEPKRRDTYFSPHLGHSLLGNNWITHRFFLTLTYTAHLGATMGFFFVGAHRELQIPELQLRVHRPPACQYLAPGAKRDERHRSQLPRVLRGDYRKFVFWSSPGAAKHLNDTKVV